MDKEKVNKIQLKKNRNIRTVILLIILLFSTVLGIFHLHYTGKRPLGVDSFCPYGAIESALTLFTQGTLLSRIQWNNFIMLISIFIIIFFFQRAFCGYICPLGFLQELFGKLGRIIFKKRFVLNQKIDFYLRFIKYLILIFTVYFSFKLSNLIIRPFDPWVAYNHITSGELFVSFSIGTLILLISLLGSMLYDRFFCKYLCPLGAFISLFNRVSIFKINRNASTCIKCHKCNNVCPMNINVEESSTLNNPECINCSECVNICPVKNTLNISIGNKFKISFLTSLIVVIAIFFGSIAFASITGQFKWWQGSGKHLGAQAIVSSCCNINNNEIQSFYGCIEENYQNKSTCNERFALKLGSIKGDITLSEAIKLSNIPLKSFINKYSFSDQEMSLTLKEVMERRGLSVSEFKEFIKSKLSQ